MLHIHDEHVWELTTQNPTEFKGLIVRLCGKIEEGNKIHKYTKRFTSEKFKNIRKSRFILIF